jgi:hypothetical protein
MGSTLTMDRQARRRARRPLSLAAAALAVAAMAWPAPAGAAQKGFVGAVVPFAHRCLMLGDGQRCLSDRDVDRMEAARVRVVRWGFRWSQIQPVRLVPPAWGAADAMIGSLASRGIRVLPVLTGTPSWAGPTHETPPIHTSKARHGWQRFVAAAVARYGPGGEYWATRYHRQFPDGRVRPITTWQVWNEQNREQTFSPRPFPRGYAQLLRLAHEGIAARDPDARVLLGGMPGFVRPTAWRYLARLYRRPGVKRRFDGVALHPYAPDPRHVLAQIKRVRRVMRAHGDGHTPIWVTELGWGSDAPDQFRINAGIDGQRRMLRRTFPRLVDRRKRWNLEHVLWFAWRDPPGRVGHCGFCESAGLFWNDQRPKPAWRVFKRLARPSR